MPDQTIYQRLEAAIRDFEGLSATFKQTVNNATVVAVANAKTCTDMAADALASATLAGKQASYAQASAQKTGDDRSATYLHRVATEQSAANAVAAAAQTDRDSKSATASMQKAAKWAENAVDVPVETGKFSAKHYAAYAETAATTAGAASDRSVDAANRAEAAAAIAETGSVPYPDVWLPFNDDLELSAGFGPFDRTPVSVSGGTIYLELKTRSASFTRATTTQYVNKSGATVTAAVNEPCFMQQGLRISAGEEVSIEQTNNDCVEFYNGKVALPVEKRDGRIYFKPTSGYLRNVRGFMRALTAQEKKFL